MKLEEEDTHLDVFIWSNLVNYLGATNLETIWETLRESSSIRRFPNSLNTSESERIPRRIHFFLGGIMEESCKINNNNSKKKNA